MLPRDAPSLINVDDPRGAVADRGRRPAGDLCDQSAGRHHARSAVVLARGARVRRADAARNAPASRSPLVGRPNVYNILAAVATGTALGLSFDAIERGVSALDGVPGRFQVVSNARDEVTVVVDYAHTDDALRNLLETARPLARGRLITVFGCGGDRDRTKRPADGRRRRPAQRRDRHHLGQPAQRGSRRASSKRSSAGITADTRRDSDQRTARDRRPPGGDRQGDRARARRAIWCWSPARATKSTR